jgi:periplasmic divalent cation tolerance protein
MTEFVVVYVTVASADEGVRVARTLVEERLAACVNQLAGVRSLYRWEGRIEESREELLIIKTRRGLFSAVEKRVRELHSYDVPEIIALPILHGSSGYLQWLNEQVRPDGE